MICRVHCNIFIIFAVYNMCIFAEKACSLDFEFSSEGRLIMNLEDICKCFGYYDSAPARSTWDPDLSQMIILNSNGVIQITDPDKICSTTESTTSSDINEDLDTFLPVQYKSIESNLSPDNTIFRPGEYQKAVPHVFDTCSHLDDNNNTLVDKFKEQQHVPSTLPESHNSAITSTNALDKTYTEYTQPATLFCPNCLPEHILLTETTLSSDIKTDITDITTVNQDMTNTLNSHVKDPYGGSRTKTHDTTTWPIRTYEIKEEEEKKEGVEDENALNTNLYAKHNAVILTDEKTETKSSLAKFDGNGQQTYETTSPVTLVDIIKPNFLKHSKEQMLIESTTINDALGQNNLIYGKGPNPELVDIYPAYTIMNSEIATRTTTENILNIDTSTTEFDIFSIDNYDKDDIKTYSSNNNILESTEKTSTYMYETTFSSSDFTTTNNQDPGKSPSLDSLEPSNLVKTDFARLKASLKIVKEMTKFATNSILEDEESVTIPTYKTSLKLPPTNEFTTTIALSVTDDNIKNKSLTTSAPEASTITSTLTRSDLNINHRKFDNILINTSGIPSQNQIDIDKFCREQAIVSYRIYDYSSYKRAYINCKLSIDNF